MRERMPRDGAIIFRDLIGKLGVLRIECAKCVGPVPAGNVNEEFGAALTSVGGAALISSAPAAQT